MIEEERYFTIKEVAKLLRVSKTSIKRRIEAKNLTVYKRLDKRGFELVIPQRELSVEIIGSIHSRQLSLCEFETIVIKRLEAMAAGRDRRTSLALKLLCDEFAQLRAEIKTLNFTAEDDSPATSLKRERLSTRQEKELAVHRNYNPPIRCSDSQIANKAVGDNRQHTELGCLNSKDLLM